MSRLLTSIFLQITICIGNVYADAELPSTTSSWKPLPKDEYNKAIIERAKKFIKEPRFNFSCAGIRMIDNGAAMDGDVIYYDEKSRELICTYGMVYCISSNPKNNEGEACNNFCPPPKWKENDCSAKYKELVRTQWLNGK